MRDYPKSQDLLDWYDRHARVMPWRVAPADRAKGVKPDPYRIWMSEIMLQQTTVAAVKAYFVKFTTLWPTVQDLAAAEDADVMAAWAGLGYYARARNLLKCARFVTLHHNGVFPRSHEQLLELPGVGPIRLLRYRPLRLICLKRSWMGMWNGSSHACLISIPPYQRPRQN